ncbi:hypothetical protein HDU82_001864, partial [Entophlyctis luteolus]
FMSKRAISTASLLPPTDLLDVGKACGDTPQIDSETSKGNESSATPEPFARENPSQSSSSFHAPLLSGSQEPQVLKSEAVSKLKENAHETISDSAIPDQQSKSADASSPTSTSHSEHPTPVRSISDAYRSAMFTHPDRVQSILSPSASAISSIGIGSGRFSPPSNEDPRTRHILNTTTSGRRSPLSQDDGQLKATYGTESSNSGHWTSGFGMRGNAATGINSGGNLPSGTSPTSGLLHGTSSLLHTSSFSSGHPRDAVGTVAASDSYPRIRDMREGYGNSNSVSSRSRTFTGDKDWRSDRVSLLSGGGSNTGGNISGSSGDRFVKSVMDGPRDSRDRDHGGWRIGDRYDSTASSTWTGDARNAGSGAYGFNGTGGSGKDHILEAGELSGEGLSRSHDKDSRGGDSYGGGSGGGWSSSNRYRGNDPRENTSPYRKSHDSRTSGLNSYRPQQSGGTRMRIMDIPMVILPQVARDSPLEDH